MGKNALTPKQEKFCQEFVKCGNASEAYRQAYNASKMKMETINRNAKALLDDNKIATRIEELNAEIKSEAIADAREIQETLTKLMRGEIDEQCVVVEGTGEGCSSARIVTKQVTPKDRIKAGELLAKIRGDFNINLNIKDKPIVKDDI